MKKRHRAREVAIQVLYQYDVASAITPNQLPPDEIAKDLKKHFDHFEVPPPVRGFSAELIAGTLKKVTELDEKIENHSPNWKISRMGFVDRNLLRMALYEMTHFEEIPVSVTIDEAVELAKQFGTAETAPFLNGILDEMAKSLSPLKK